MPKKHTKPLKMENQEHDQDNDVKKEYKTEKELKKLKKYNALIENRNALEKNFSMNKANLEEIWSFTQISNNVWLCSGLKKSTLETVCESLEKGTEINLVKPEPQSIELKGSNKAEKNNHSQHEIDSASVEVKSKETKKTKSERRSYTYDDAPSEKDDSKPLNRLSIRPRQSELRNEIRRRSNNKAGDSSKAEHKHSLSHSSIDSTNLGITNILRKSTANSANFSIVENVKEKPENARYRSFSKPSFLSEENKAKQLKSAKPTYSSSARRKPTDMSPLIESNRGYVIRKANDDKVDKLQSITKCKSEKKHLSEIKKI